MTLSRKWCARSRSKKRVILFPGSWRTSCGPACFCRFHCMIGSRSEILFANRRKLFFELCPLYFDFVAHAAETSKHEALSTKHDLVFQSESPRLILDDPSSSYSARHRPGLN